MGARVRLTRSGGIAGLDMVASVDVDELPPATAASLRTALAGLDLGAAAAGGRRRAATAPPGADRYQYDLEVTDHGHHRLTAHEPAVGPELQAVIDVLMPLARPE